MSGWKSKVGGALVSVGSVLGVIGKAIGGDTGENIMLIGTGLAGLGSGILGIGIAHKIEKSKEK